MIISKIGWGTRYNDSYNYGSSINIRKTNVSYSSPMMPVGAVIKSWSSKGSYNVDRVSPLLPILINNKFYRVHFKIDASPENLLLYTVEYLDEQGNVIGTEYFEDDTFYFFYPDNAVNYNIKIVNKRHKLLVFHYMSIDDIPKDSNQFLSILNSSDVSLLTLDNRMNVKSDETIFTFNYNNNDTSVVTYPDVSMQRFSVHALLNEDTSFLSIIYFAKIILELIEKKVTTIYLLKGIGYSNISKVVSYYPIIFSKAFPDIKFLTDIELNEDNDLNVDLYINIIKKHQMNTKSEGIIK